MNKKLLLAAMVHAAIGGVTPDFSGQARPAKPCRNCGKAHTHNNSYCSAECCKADRRESK